MPPGAWRLEIHETLPSTSAALVARAEAGAAAGLALLAHRQTAGHGRQGRGWSSPAGNLHLSLLLRPSGPARELPQWSLLAGVALAEAAREVVPDPAAIRLKWPNDLLRDGAKCAGILADGALAPDGAVAWLVLGFGVNLVAAPPLPDRPTARLGAALLPEAFARRLLARLDHWRDALAAQGFAPIRAAWSAFGPAPGEAIAVRAGGGWRHGRFAGLAPDGGLLLEEGSMCHTIAAGEVLDQTARPAGVR
jgi:BirA family transcriptional regulator, biotin operon repressor / biotin---[acetyl-CoA-carboxylase] ligase